MSNLRLLTSLIKAKLETSSQKPVAAASYVLARLAVELRSIGFNPVISDQVNTSDQVSFEIVKNLFDTVIATENIQVTDLREEPTDVLTLVEAVQIVMDWLRTFDDAVIADDLAAKSVTKNIEDAVSAIDQLVDVSLAKLQQQADAASVGDVLVFALEKLVTDAATASDVLSYVMSYVRNLQDAVAPSDALSVDFVKALSDSVSVADELSTSAEQLVGRDDSLGVSDSFALTAIKNLTESIATSETVARDFIKALSETIGTTEVFAYVFTKDLTETVSSVETFAVDIYKYVAGADDLTVADAAAFDFTKPATESIVLADASAFDFVKGLTESLTAGDSGLLFATDYADISYFAEDFVGTSRTF